MFTNTGKGDRTRRMGGKQAEKKEEILGSTLSE